MGVADRFISLLPPRHVLLRHYRLLAPFFPAIVSRLRLPEADVVVSSSYAFAHRLRTPNGAPRVCYTYSPLRFAWSMRDQYRRRWARGPVSSKAFDAFTAWMRASDVRGSRSVHQYLAPGPYVADQVFEFYGRTAEIVDPPVDCDLFRPGPEPPGDFFLFAGRLIEPYKQVSILVEAFNRLGEKLIIAGDGPERRRLERIAKPNITFAGQLSDDALVGMMQACKAAVFPSQDDFGLIPVEVNACGRPVIAFGGGGATSTVIPGLTGELFGEQTAASLAAAVSSFEPTGYDPEELRAHAMRWSAPRFRERIVEAVLRAKTEADGRSPARDLASV